MPANDLKLISMFEPSAPFEKLVVKGIIVFLVDKFNAARRLLTSFDSLNFFLIKIIFMLLLSA